MRRSLTAASLSAAGVRGGLALALIVLVGVLSTAGSAAGLPLRADRDAAYREYNGARAGYDRPLLALSRLVLAPEALWNTWPDRDEFGRFGPTPGDAG